MIYGVIYGQRSATFDECRLYHMLGFPLVECSKDYVDFVMEELKRTGLWGPEEDVAARMYCGL